MPRIDSQIIDNKPYVSLKRIQELTGLSLVWLRLLIKNGKFHAVKFGVSWYVDEKEVLKYLKRDVVRAHQTTEKAHSVPCSEEVEDFFADDSDTVNQESEEDGEDFDV